jgi:hypothetical protein
VLEDGISLVQYSTDGLEDEVFWQNHATYERFALQEKLPSRSEISREADDMARQMRDAEIAFGESFFPEVKYSTLEIL